MIPVVAVVGGGWAGCAAAAAVQQAGAQAVLIERTDLLLGTGLAGGIMFNNGRLTAARELQLMGGGALFDAIDRVTLHRRVDFPGHRHASLYDVDRIERAVRSALESMGVRVLTQSRAVDVVRSGTRLAGVVLSDGSSVAADAFVDATGTAGPQANCGRVNGCCVMCVLRCPTFGPRVSISAKAGVAEITGPLFSAMSGSCKLMKRSLAPWLVRRLEEQAAMVIPVPRYMARADRAAHKACQQYALPEFYDNIVLLDTSQAKLMAPFFPLSRLQAIAGFESAAFEDPRSGGIGNSIRYNLITPHDTALKVDGVDNLFCAGEKAGLLVGHTEAICTGTLAGHNAVRHALGLPPFRPPVSTVLGDLLHYLDATLRPPVGMPQKTTFAGGPYFSRMDDTGLYTTDEKRIAARVQQAGCEHVFSRRLA